MNIDGASRGNPGPAGAGIYLVKNNTEVEKHHVYLGTKTNNQAEYFALALGLFFARKAMEKDRTSTRDLAVISDSELLVRQMRGEYKIKNEGLRQFSMLITTLMHGIHCTFRHVLRDQNKQADKLANEGIDGRGNVPDEFITLLAHHGIKLT